MIAASSTDASIQKKIFGSGMTTVIISIDEVNEIMKMITPFGVAGLLISDIGEPIEN